MNPARWARLDERWRPWLVRWPGLGPVRLYSRGRAPFLKALLAEEPPPRTPPPELARTLWGLRFRSPLGNAAGMFKNGEGYPLAVRQGAGFYLAGSTTALPRAGNRRFGIRHPFAPYPRSHAATNWLGLPNDGDQAVAARLRRVEKVAGCPLGVSLSPAPELEGEQQLAALVAGLEGFAEAGVDFLEINESCPNTEQGPVTTSDLAQRLAALSRRFLARRSRPLPVVVKFSCDTDPRQVPELVRMLVAEGFDGVNFGNTSQRYGELRPAIAPSERRLYDLFSTRFGGGVSGRPLKEVSFSLAAAAVEAAAQERGGAEFHVIRTGGVETAADVRASEAAGISLNGWYTGYYEAFGRCGHSLYEAIFEELSREKG